MAAAKKSSSGAKLVPTTSCGTIPAGGCALGLWFDVAVLDCSQQSEVRTAATHDAQPQAT